MLPFVLIGCDGLDIDTVNSGGDGESSEEFTSAELAFNVVFSSTVLNDTGFNNRDGFVVLFNNTSDLDQISLRVDNDDNALVGNYEWLIVNDELQVTYPNGVTCTSDQTSETDLQSTATSSCSGGEPNSDQINGTLIRALVFDDEELETRSITIENEDDDRRIDFFSNGTFEVTDIDSDGDEIPATTQAGTFGDHAELNNVVQLSNPASDESSLLVLLQGSLDGGTILELRYSSSTLPSAGTLNEVLIHEIDDNDEWDAVSRYEDIDVEL